MVRFAIVRFSSTFNHSFSNLFLLTFYFPLLLFLSRHSFQDFSLHCCLESQSFISFHADGPLLSSRCLLLLRWQCLSFLSPSHLEQTKSSGLQRAYYLLRQPPSHSLSFLGVKLGVLFLVAQSCLTLCNPIYCSPPGASVHGVFQARILEWVAVQTSRGSPQPRHGTQVSCIAGRFFNV